MNNFKNLTVWQKAVELSINIYETTAQFPVRERYNLISQLNRVAVSVASNIAEGAGRNSNKDFINFLSISNGSCFELETQLIIANRLKFIHDGEFEALTNQITAIQKMIYNLQKSLKA